MKPYTKKLMAHYGYGIDDVILCQFCGKRRAVDCHHINGRIGIRANEVENLIFLCRECHSDAHAELISKKQLINAKKQRNEKTKY